MTRSKLCIIFGLFLTAEAGSICPPQDNISPCTCKVVQDGVGDDFPIITCRDIEDEDVLEKSLQASKGYKVFELKIVHSSLRYLPHDAFVGTTFEVLSFENSSISALSDTDVALGGLEDYLHLIEIFNCSFTSSWNWSQLSRMKHLMEVLVHDSQLKEITKGIAHIQHVDIQSFAFQRNNIQWIEEGTFAPFTGLNRLTLDGNQLQHIKRSMLPMPANFLVILGLSDNKLRSLPHDLFSYMPEIKSVYLSGNPMHTIEEIVFKPVWRQIHLLLFSGTPLSCDCRVAWLTKMDNTNKYIHAECQAPSEFKGLSLDSIKLDEYCSDKIYRRH